MTKQEAIDNYIVWLKQQISSYSGMDSMEAATKTRKLQNALEHIEQFKAGEE